MDGVNSPPLIRIPVVGLRSNAFALICHCQLVVVVHPRPSAKNIIPSSRRKPRYQQGRFYDVCHATLHDLCNAVTKDVRRTEFVGNIVLVESVNGICVPRAQKWARGENEVWAEAFDVCSDDGVAENYFEDTQDGELEVVEQVGEGEKAYLGFNVERCHCSCRNLSQLAIQLNRRLPLESNGIVRLCQVASEHALHPSVALS